MKVQSVADQLFFTTVRIDTVSASDAKGSGTGFFFNHTVGDTNYPFVVTNKHVVMGMRQGELTFLRRKDDLPVLGSGCAVEIGPDQWKGQWHGHPDDAIDIAICALLPLVNQAKNQLGVDLFYRCVDSRSIPTQQQHEELDAIEPVIFIGYPNGVWDSKNLLPVARRGTTATPVEVDFENTPRFLIDASVFGGSSGSPVFLMDTGARVSRSGGVQLGSTRFHFLGVIAAVFYRTDLNQIVSVPIPTQDQPMAVQREMIDLGIVFKAKTVLDTVEAVLKAHNIPVTEAPRVLDTARAIPDPPGLRGA